MRIVLRLRFGGDYRGGLELDWFQASAHPSGVADIASTSGQAPSEAPIMTGEKVNTEELKETLTQLKAWQAVRVVWDDAHSPTAEWHTVDDYEPDKDTTATTLGFYWAGCKAGYFTVAATVFFHPDGSKPATVGDITHIPMGWVNKLEVINGGEEGLKTGKGRSVGIQQTETNPKPPKEVAHRGSKGRVTDKDHPVRPARSKRLPQEGG